MKLIVKLFWVSILESKSFKMYILEYYLEPSPTNSDHCS